MKNRRQTRRGRIFKFLLLCALLLIATSAFSFIKPTNAALAEIDPDDWSLELLFFDSTVNKGRDPIVDEEWIIPSSDRSETFERTITMQVNYRNEVLDRDYAPGELQIKVPNPFKSANLNAGQLSAQIAIGANNSTQTAYDWNYNYGNYTSGEFVFTSNTALEAASSIEGSIQMTYVLTSKNETVERYLDSCVHAIEQAGLKAVMNGVVESNEASFNFSRTYNHAWTKSEYNINTLISKISSYDNLGENPADYTWVKYRFYGKSSTYASMGYTSKDYVSSSRLLIGLSDFRIRDLFPADVKLIDRYGNELSADDEGYLQISENITNSSYSVCSSSSYNMCYELYVGYPKDKYNDELGTSQITNTVELRGTYSSEDFESALANNMVEFNINDFAFTYNGGEYGDYDSTNKTITFDGAQPVQAWYVELYDLEESIQNTNFSTSVVLKSSTLPTNGTLHNFNYVKVYQNGTFINPGTLENYTDGITRDFIADYDNTIYGEYLQRSTANTNWKPYVVPTIEHSEGVGKNQASAPIYKPAEEAFTGSFYISASTSDYTHSALSDWNVIKDKMRDSDMNHFVNLYDLFPLGMIPDSTPEEIINSLSYCPTGNTYKQKNGEALFSSNDECYAFVKEHTSVTITKNWHNTGRWHIAIKVDFSERPFTTYNTSGGNSNAHGVYSPLRYTIKYRIPYDSYAEYGKTFRNTAWRAPEYQWSYINNNHRYDNDNGTVDPDVVDIDDNGKTDERMSTASLNINLVSVTSTTQDLQVSVLTDHSGTYEIDDVRSGHGEDYVYKLRMRTGNNKVTNAVLYDHIEEKYEDNNYWKGNFNGIDTSFAESKLDYYDNPIKIKTYWSPKTDAGTLKDDNTWQEYDEETTDKTQVRSLAFQYLDQEGNPALLMQSSYSYILVKMKAPEDENINAFAYNNLHSEWNAIDNLTGNTIYNIVGIESNITRVYLSEKFDLKVTKAWDDYDNYYNKRPDTISFTLYNGDEEIETKTMNIKEGDSEIIFEQLNSIDQDNYRVIEEDVDGYIVSFKQDSSTLYYTFTNKIDAPNPVAADIVVPQTEDNYIQYIFIGIGTIAIAGVGTWFFVRRRA